MESIKNPQYTPPQIGGALISALADLCAQAMREGLAEKEILRIMEQCTGELRRLIASGGVQSATQRALAEMRQTQSGSMEDLQQFFADAGAVVIVADEDGIRRVKPKPGAG